MSQGLLSSIFGRFFHDPSVNGLLVDDLAENQDELQCLHGGRNDLYSFPISALPHLATEAQGNVASPDQPAMKRSSKVEAAKSDSTLDSPVVLRWTLLQRSVRTACRSRSGRSSHRALWHHKISLFSDLCALYVLFSDTCADCEFRLGICSLT